MLIVTVKFIVVQYKAWEICWDFIHIYAMNYSCVTTYPV
jgi:endonuclease IV